MTIKLESKVEDGATYVKIKGGRGSWGRPVVDDQGNFYRSLRVAADVLACAASTISDSIETGSTVRGRIFAYATEAECKKQVADSAEATVKREKLSQKANGKQDLPFIGVKWPDGNVTVKLQGSDWRMERASFEQVPEEIRNNCRWM